MGWIGLIGLSLGLLGLAAPASAQSVKAYVDRNPVMADETLQLIVETENISSGESPDWQVLYKNFDVLGTTQSQQTSIINLRTMNRIRWTVTLAPKRAGNLTIPPIRVGPHNSLPIQLTVNEPNSTSQSKDTRDIFLEADVDSRSPILQGQVLLTLRLVSAVSVQEGRLDDPEIEWGIVERVGKDVSFETTRNGRQYQVTERRYVITPQQSGPHVIPPVLFSGTVDDGRTRGMLFDELFGNRGGLGGDLFRTSRSIHRRSPEILLQIQDLPPNLNGRAWLPAKSLTVTETWSGDSEKIQMGDSLTRTVVIRAKGQRGEQLPELTLPDQSILKIYPDKAKIHTDFDGTWMLGSREEQHVIVPTQPGTVMLPAIHIPWWNVENSRWEEARLPARALTVLGTRQPATSEDLISSIEVPSRPSGGLDRQATASSTYPLLSPPDSRKAVPWHLIAGGSLMMWIVTLVAWWRDRQKRKGQHGAMAGKVDKKLESERKALQGVKAACLEQSAEKTRTALLQWASIKQGGHPCRSLGMVARLLDQPVPDRAEISAAIWNLDRALYTTSAGTQHWDGQRFWEIVKPAMTAKPLKAHKQEKILPPLFLH